MRPDRRTSQPLHRARGPLLFAAVLFIAVGVLALAVVPPSRSLVVQWFQRDAEARSRLIFNSIHGSVERAVADGDLGRLPALFEGVTRDERVLALGLCDRAGRLRAPTPQMPKTFSCRKAARTEAEAFSTILDGGRRFFVATFPVAVPGGRTDLVILQDLSYVSARSGQVQTLTVTVLAATAVVVAGLGALLVAFLMRGWMQSLRTAVATVRTGAAGPAPEAEATFMGAQIQALLKDLQVSRAPTETPEIEWTPATLQSLLGEALPGADVIIVSNREPYIHNRTEDGIAVQTPASGLVSALEPVMRACGGTWIAHGSGTADREVVDANDRIDVPPDAPAYKLRRIWISDEEQDGYYYGLANEGLWPLCHIAFVRPVFRESDWRAYVEINRRFAEAVAQEARTEDPLVLVQDYHFALAPRMIRERLPKATIVTFWHIPWPNAETFGICPWRQEVIEGLLGSTILGFHTQFHCNNFLETVDRFIESRIDREHSTVVLGGQETMVRPYPISIEWPPKALAGLPPVEESRTALRERYGLDPEAKVAVGIERFDYTKGILDRMSAVDALLTAHPEWRGRFAFIQAAAPTRSKLPSYGKLQAEAIALADEINARHGGDGYQPIHLAIRHHEPSEVFELFRAADLCVVSSLHDGMNLVAKEFVASRDDERGVLVLSSFTGASRELAEALIVNPYNPAEMAAAFDTALRMPPEEQIERMRLMRQHVREQNVYRWAGRMLVDAARTRQRQRILDLASAPAAGTLQLVGDRRAANG